MGPLSMNPWDVAQRQAQAYQAAQQAPPAPPPAQPGITPLPGSGNANQVLAAQLGAGAPTPYGTAPQALGMGGVNSITGTPPGGIPPGWQAALAQVGQAAVNPQASGTITPIAGGPSISQALQGALSPQAIQQGAGILGGRRPLIRS